MAAFGCLSQRVGEEFRHQTAGQHGGFDVIFLQEIEQSLKSEGRTIFARSEREEVDGCRPRRDLPLANCVRARRGLPFMHDVEGYGDTVAAGPLGKPTWPAGELGPVVPLINFNQIGALHGTSPFRFTQVSTADNRMA